ncbi:3-hydroxybutyryl-CoA dehydrogenase [Acidisarcina polymorpha]|uniref:3-hydroxybutyryl-CoA dehydrogenase n=1 Tax=Acidisarcina polymorpha TaxID=2211140 RepID=A0A2Z5G7M7_9BACT|nr:3-hydroxyacyl-CoA dehydrogenase NAD-binding domain-containing protein [Acidisarcina polymorpha]AXC14998.1 3-hydroxybutyryl-CoA dehydrogenase [Acidisarcina polymorpha]
MKIGSVAVIGAGARGRELAALFAAKGFAVTLEDILPSKLKKAAELLGAPDGTVSAEGGMYGKVRFATSVEDAVRTADLVIDCVPDELESKLEIFSLLDRMAPPHSAFLTPTQSLSIADLASCTYRADRCIALVLPNTLTSGTVRLTSTSLTAPEVLAAVQAFWMSLGLAVELQMDRAEPSVAAGTLF